MSVLIKIVWSRVGFFSSLCTRLAGRRSLMGRCSCWAVDWKCCHRERGKGEVAGLWQSELEIEEAFCHLHHAATQHNVGEYVWIWVLNLILCSPGWEVCKGSCSAHMDGIVLPHHCYLMMLSWLTLRESPWFKREGQHKTVLFRVQGERAGNNTLTKSPCAIMYLYAFLLTPHQDVHTPNIFCQPWGHWSRNQNCASVLMHVLVSSCGRSECSQGTTLMVSALHPHFSYHYELRGGH